ncbi:MAG TPA: ABC transporter permease [Vicinamibacterales bacterium]|nr:ABC transporter permease [Vicinamibacterales bacterium]
MWSDLRYRLRALFRRRAMERDLAAELQFHVDRQAQAQGGDPRAGLAGVEQIKEACRDERGIGALDRARQDLGYAWRLSVRQPAFTMAVVGTLALGIGGATTIFAVVDGVLLKPLPYADAGRISRLGRSFGGVRVTAISAADHANLATRARTLSAVGVARTETADVAADGPPERLEIASVSAAYFDVLGVRAARGQVLSAADDGPAARLVAVISDTFWRRRLGSRSNPIGQSISINGQPHTVVGVMPRGFRGPEALNQQDIDLWLPLGRLKLSTDPDDASLGTIALVRPDTDSAAVTSELAAIGGGTAHFWIAPLQAETIRGSASGLWLLFGSVSLLLLLACSNVAHLFLVRAADRTREIAVRAAMGAGGARIARQLLTETIGLSLAGGAAGALLAYAGVAVVRAWAPADLPRVQDLQVDVRVLVFAFLIAAVAGALFGIAPARQARRSDFARILRGALASTSSRASERTRGALVIVQTALAVTLVLGASLLANSLWRLSHVVPGFDPSNVVWLDVTLPERAYAGPQAKTGFFDEFLARGRALAGVESMSLIQGAPLGGGNSVATVAPEGRLPAQGDQPARAAFHVVAPGYFETMRIARLDGRDFAAHDRLDSPRVAIVSRAFARRYWPGDRAVGKRFWMGRVAADAPLTEVIGVVEDVRQYSLADAPIPVVYRVQSQVPRGTVTVVARHDGRSAVAAIDGIREIIRRLDSALSLDRAGTMDAQVSRSIREPRFRALALSAFGIIACAIACVGLYGSLASVVRARRRELGVRLALGARTGALEAMIIRRGLLLASAGIVIGVAGAAGGSSVMASLVFGISPVDLPTYAVAALLMLALATAASWLPARRAAGINPVDILRN